LIIASHHHHHHHFIMFNNLVTNSQLGDQQQHQQHNHFSSSPLNPPSCIVIGCKNGNGISNVNVKYYQVPSIQSTTTTITNNTATARQWYINTLREDLLDYVNSQRFVATPSSSAPIHYVCIEHFDEESFIITNIETSNGVNTESLSVSMDVNGSSSATTNGGSEIVMILKEDAVPSLFEFDVFQKMIAHQERFALNQQQKQQMAAASRLQALTTKVNNATIQNQASPLSSSSMAPRTTSLLSNLILNDGQQDNLKTSQKSLKSPLQATVASLNSDGSTTTTMTMASMSPLSSSSSSPVLAQSKRTRIDPDVRAALMQRVPKAVKRTSAMSMY
jgi:hypothetical protein